MEARTSTELTAIDKMWVRTGLHVVSTIFEKIALYVVLERFLHRYDIECLSVQIAIEPR